MKNGLYYLRRDDAMGKEVVFWK